MPLQSTILIKIAHSNITVLFRNNQIPRKKQLAELKMTSFGKIALTEDREKARGAVEDIAKD